jgi:FtsH-binding integral membrane protein
MADRARMPGRAERGQRPRQPGTGVDPAVRVRPAAGRERERDDQLLLGSRSDRGRQAFGATALFVGGLGAGGYAIRRDLSFLYRLLFWLLLALIVAGIVLIFVRIPALYTAYALIGLAIFGGYTVVDFNRLRRAGTEEAIPLAAGIFLDVFNVFLLFLRLFARSS